KVCVVDGEFTEELYCVRTAPTGTLYFPGSVNTKLRAYNFVNQGYMTLGSTTDPVRANRTCKLQVPDHQLEQGVEGGTPGYDPHGFGGGLIRLGGKDGGHGTTVGALTGVAEVRPAALRCAGTQGPRAGATSLNLTATPTNLQIGDKLYFPSYQQA